MRVYFDNSATTKIDPKVREAMTLYLDEEYGNASSIHSFGQEASKAVEASREKLADFFSVDTDEIFFTSGATESNNLAIWGTLNKWAKKNKKYHFITSKIEHPAILEVYKKIEKMGHEVTYLDVDKNGVVKIKSLVNKIKEKTLLVSVMYVNNEVGSIQPVGQIGEIIKKAKQKRQDKLPLYFQVDAVQAINYLDCDVQKLKCDFLSLSGHKIHGPKGIGALFIKRGVQIDPLMQGGHQEKDIRPGTYNVPGIVGLGQAIESIKLEQEKNTSKIKKLKEKILKGLEAIEDIRINSDSKVQSAHIINVSFNNAEGESILMMLDMNGIAVSTGSACSSGNLAPSHVLTAMKVPVEWIHGSIRISLSKFNNEQEVNYFLQSLKTVVAKLRQMSPTK